MSRTRGTRASRPGTTKDETAEFDATKVLLGLSPELVLDLARLVGATLDDLQVTFQLLPWGDRATLAAYGVVTLDERSDQPGRGLVVHPVAIDLVNAAAEAAAATADSAAVMNLLLERDRAKDDDEAAAAAELPEPRIAEPTHTVTGVVQAVQQEGDEAVLVVAVAGELIGATSGEPSWQTPSPAFLLREDTHVTVTFSDAE